ncbi:hypothetical protein CVIRNUC_002193 [Coccomyxa viridis]|uniref:Heme oxygenase n=1 Tax=Coccomyxa viridis TaxID=1274662 RepID=A0AAV1HWP9_9CHLO|nr:hypothetical protein CVIRNUC_002193 [Coccomyxa viridis]
MVAARLVVACTDKILYARALAAFWHVHSALEAGVAKNAGHKALGEVAGLTRSLHRATAFEADLQHLLGPEWRSRVEQRSPAVVAYVEHLADISSTDPVRLIAHAYTQHMALLAGGQRIRKFVASTVPGLQGQEGVSVFSFEEPVDPMKKEYKAAVNSQEELLGTEGTQKVLEEHVKVFEMNNDIIRAFPVHTRHTLGAVRRILPPEVILGACATLFALFMMWVTPKVMEAAAAWEGRDMEACSTDAVDTCQMRPPEG